MRKYLPAYTLVELLVVMAIVAMLFTLGIVAFVGLRESTILNKNTNDFLSEAKTQLSRARNVVYTQDELNAVGQSISCSQIATTKFAPDAVGFYLDKTSQKPQLIKCLNTSISTQGNFCCTLSNDNDNPFSKIDTKINYTADCDGILFEYSTGRMFRFNPAGSTGATIDPGSSTTVNAVSQTCNVTIANPSLPVSNNKVVIFNSAEGTMVSK